MYPGFLSGRQVSVRLLSLGESLRCVGGLLHELLALIRADIDFALGLVGIGRQGLQFALLDLDLVLEVLGLVCARASMSDR